MKARYGKRRGSGSRLRRQLRRLPKELRAGFGEIFEKHGKELSSEIAMRAPKDTGDLSEQAHYRVSNDKLGVRIGYSANKAGFKRKWKKGGFKALWAEFGTRHHAAQPFIRPTWSRNLLRVIDEVSREVNTRLRNMRNVK